MAQHHKHSPIQKISQQIAQTLGLMKRALFTGPIRIIGKDHTMPTFINKIKGWVGRLSPSMWILAGSIVVLIYAIIAGTQNNNQNTILTHNSATEEVVSHIEPNEQLIQAIARAQLNDAIISDPSSNNSESKNHAVTDIVISYEDPANHNIQDPTIQLIYDRYNAMSDGSYIVANYFDTYMRSSDFVQKYFTTAKIEKLVAATIQGIDVKDVKTIPSNRSDRIQLSYDISYTLRDGQQTFDETWIVTLRDQGGWKIGTIRCETRGCSTHPIFQPSRYGIR